MCAFTARVRFLRRRGLAGLRNILFGLPMLYFSRSAHGDFCVCEVKAVPQPCGQYAGHLSAWRSTERLSMQGLPGRLHSSMNSVSGAVPVYFSPAAS